MSEYKVEVMTITINSVYMNCCYDNVPIQSFDDDPQTIISIEESLIRDSLENSCNIRFINLMDKETYVDK